MKLEQEIERCETPGSEDLIYTELVQLEYTT